MLWRMRVRWWAFCCLVCWSGLSLACSSGKMPQYPEDHERFLRIDAAMETLRTAYVNRNFAEIERLMLPHIELEQLGQDIRHDFETFQEISLDFSIGRINIDGETVDVFVHWQGQWKRAPTDKGIRERGQGVLRWIGVQSILLQDLRGDLPFGMATRVSLPGPTS